MLTTGCRRWARARSERRSAGINVVSLIDEVYRARRHRRCARDAVAFGTRPAGDPSRAAPAAATASLPARL
jgi:hypothetical protein